MNLYRYMIPTHTNAGLSYELARKRFAAEALKLAGGYTEQPIAQGVWKGEARTYKETVIAYDVACEPRVSAALEDAFWLSFPDQEALCVTNLGPCAIRERPAVDAKAA